MTLQRIWIPYYTMMRKEFVRIMRIWSQTLLPPAVTSSLYFIIFGAFIGSQLAPIQGYSYMQFIVPGLIMMSVITSSYSNTVSTFFFAKFIHNLDEMLVSPTPNWVIVLGFVYPPSGLQRAGAPLRHHAYFGALFARGAHQRRVCQRL